MLQFSIDKTRCTGCGQCVDDCISGIISLDENAVPSIAPDLEALCIRCQHCLAVCPEGALSILGKLPGDSAPLPPGSLACFDQMSLLVRGRRSYRHFRQENVAPAVLTEILNTVSYAPTGVNACQVTLTVIDDIQAMHRFQRRSIAAFRAGNGQANVPERYASMRDLPDDRLTERFFRTAPHLIVASAPPSAPCGTEDVAIAIAYFDLLAQSAGLGCVWWGLLRLLMSAAPEIRQSLGIPGDHVFSAALFGNPDIQFARTVQKDGAATIRRPDFSE
ncbi:MAG: nitroreductase family protein [Capsulimonadaceae bacterium]|nr:nitroreductase family protein [Capsulimonadaceae bacterium]